jgi:hypothetical protein
VTLLTLSRRTIELSSELGLPELRVILRFADRS